ncbi:MAG TPA: hypothetical protein VJ953_14665 [Saprospiraceae bacterium]|nr:hypothetical protein [Saprospiraceae bacterium]
MIRIRFIVNCEAFKYTGDVQKYKACKTAEKRQGHYQFSREYAGAIADIEPLDALVEYDIGFSQNGERIHDP